MRALPIGVQPKQILWVPVIDGLHQPWEEVELDADLDGMALTENLHDAVDGEHVLSVDDLLRGDPLTTPAQVKSLLHQHCEAQVFVLRLLLVIRR